MSNKVKIISESCCDLSRELIERYGFDTLPMPVSIDGVPYLDGFDITPDQLFAKVDETGKTPKTSAIPLGELLDTFKKYHDEGYEVIYFSLSSGISTTVNNARMAAQEVPGVYVVDTMSLSTGEALLMIKAHELAEAGLSAKEAAEQTQEIAKTKCHASFVIDKLDYLYKGGRCSGLAALGANLLKLKPCLELIDSKIEVGKKYRGAIAPVLLEYTENKLKNRENLDLSKAFVTHTGFSDPQTVDDVVKKVLELAPFKEVHVTRAGSGISSHCGPGTLGVLFLSE